jgi:hypothetical protein
MGRSILNEIVNSEARQHCRDPVSMPPMMIYSAFHAGNVIPGPINFSDRLRIADYRSSIHFFAADFLRFALKPACALPPLPAPPSRATLNTNHPTASRFLDEAGAPEPKADIRERKWACPLSANSAR